MYSNSTTQEPMDMKTRDIVVEMIESTKANGWGDDFHCLVPKGLGTSLISRCRAWLSRARQQSAAEGLAIKHFKMGAQMVSQIGDRGQVFDVVVFRLYQTRQDRMADRAMAALTGINAAQEDKGTQT